MLAYSDESGTPGTALHGNDWFIVVIIFFKNKTACNIAKRKILSLRRSLKLPDDYEFHHIDDSKQIQNAFYELILELDFSYTVYGIEKSFNRKFCSEINMANLIVEDIRRYDTVSLMIDRNEKLYTKLGKTRKRHRAKNIHFSESDSDKEDLLQVADYVVACEMARKRKKYVPAVAKKIEIKRSNRYLLNR